MEDSPLRIRFAGVVGHSMAEHKISRSMAARTLDQTLWRMAQLLQNNNVHVMGALVESPETAAPTQEQEMEKMNLRIFPTGQIFNIFVPQKCAQIGCRLDESPFQKVVNAVYDLVLQAPANDSTILVLNRFGKEESKGHGYSKIFELAAQKDIPVIIGVSNNATRKGENPLRKAWETFIEGTTGTSLESDEDAITRWCRDNHILKV